jgi:uncharacterized membrane protein
MSDETHTPLWRTKGGVVLLGFLAVAAFYLFTEHTAHVFGVLPFLLILSCPVMHLFMHHGHGGHGVSGPAPPVADKLDQRSVS